MPKDCKNCTFLDIDNLQGSSYRWHVCKHPSIDVAFLPHGRSVDPMASLIGVLK